MPSNFIFLQKDYPLLYDIASLAEQYLHSDPNTCMFKLRQFTEVMVSEIFQIEHIQLPVEGNQATKITHLKREGIIEPIIADLFHQLRLKGNDAVHSVYANSETATTLLQMAYKLARWFALSYGEGTMGHKGFVLPEKNTLSVADLQSEKEAQELQIAELSKALENLQKQQKYWEEAQTKEFIAAKKERSKRSVQHANDLQLSEAETRKIIDAQLQEAGWEADSENLRYSKGTRPQKGKNIAIAEFPTDKGKADYALFAGLKLVGIVEAKPQHKDISSILAVQCKDYATHIKSEHSEYIINEWGAYKVPFIFATNGRKYLRQLETKSGIWFLDTRQNDNIPKALQSWKSPQGLLEDLEKDIEKANQKLRTTSYDLLRDKNGLNLREYQVKAVEKTEEALQKGRQNILLSMATGTGKTRTMLGMIYRFLESQRFKRILFLVDRTSLGEQAHDVFKEVKISDFQTLDNIYNVKGLEEKAIDRETKIHFSTVQAMVKRIVYNEGDNIPSVSDYDLIIIDEAHRGYTLDKELDEDEFNFRNQDDFVSKYRMVIDYFDAVKIAVTATPALHTTEIFGKPIYEYSYREAVLDGYLVDYDLPIQIVTQLRQDGIHYQKGATIKVVDLDTNEVKDYSEIEDEMNFEVEQFNKKIIVEDFNRVVLEEIAKDLDPEGDGKTLIFAVDDAHADMIVNILREIYQNQGVDNQAVMKITGSVGNKKRVLEAIKHFKNERFPNIVVTVDLLTTGVDVPEIDTLVFLRRVKSRILFEQMMGRATRLCPKINKENFRVYDPVGVFESLVDVSQMKPIVTQPSATLNDIWQGIFHSEEEATIEKYHKLLVGKLQRKIKNIHKKEEAYFQNLTQKSSQEFVETLKNLSVADIKPFLEANGEAVEKMFYSKSNRLNYKVISDAKDSVAERYQGYGGAEKRPEDYIESFAEFVRNNQNKIAALQILSTRPKELTRTELKSLLLEMEQQGYTVKQINHAWNTVKNVDITVDIIGVIRTLTLGNSLVDYKIRLENAFKKLKENHEFSKMEEKWLDRIEKYLQKEQFIDIESFDTGAFRNEGGYQKINKVFKNQLDTIVDELKEYLFVV